MARSRKQQKEDVVEQNGTLESAPPAIEPRQEPSPTTPATAPATPATELPPRPNGNGARRPVASWKYPAALGVNIEVALWPHSITLQSGDTLEVFNATVTRNYKDA